MTKQQVKKKRCKKHGEDSPHMDGECIMCRADAYDKRVADNRTARIDEFLSELPEDEELLYPTDLKEAIIGSVSRIGSSFPMIILLDRRRCIDILVRRDGMTEEDANEHFDFNVIGSYVGEGTPAFADLIDFSGPLPTELGDIPKPKGRKSGKRR